MKQLALKTMVTLALGLLLTGCQTTKQCDYATGHNCTVEQITEFNAAYKAYMLGIANGDINPNDLQVNNATDVILQSSHISDWLTPNGNGFTFHTPNVWK